MKYLKKYDTFNEELLGGIIDFFKKIWDKAIKDLEEMANDPNKIKEWAINNALNPKDDTNVFSQVLKEFQNKPTANDQDCLTLVDNLLDPETGSLGKQGIGMLFNNKALQGDDMKAKRAMLEFIINTSRNKTIADGKVKYAGGPADGKVDPKKKNIDLKDTNHLPELKKVLVAQKDEKKKKDDTLKWVNATLIPVIQNYVKSIREEDVKASLQKQGIEIPGGDYKEGDEVIYLLKDKKKEDWDKLPDDQKNKPGEPPASDIVGVKKIEKIDGDNITFKDKDGKDFIKTKDEIIGKTTGEEKGPNAQDLAKKLGDIKTDEDKMKKVSSFVDFINDEKNKDKLAEIEKTIGGGE